MAELVNRFSSLTSCSASSSTRGPLHVSHAVARRLMMGRDMLLMPLMLLHVMLMLMQMQMMVFRTLLMLLLAQRVHSSYQSASLECTMYMMYGSTS